MIRTKIPSTNSASSRKPNKQRLAAASIAGGAALTVYGVSRRDRIGAAMAAGGVFLAYQGTAASRPQLRQLRASYTINRPADEIYKFLQQPGNWSRVLPQAKFDGNPNIGTFLGCLAGASPENLSEIIAQEEGKSISWHSQDSSSEYRGVLTLRPAPGNRGTELSAVLDARYPRDPFLRVASRIAGLQPHQQLREALRRVKQLLEAGEIPTTAGQPHGRRGIKGAVLRALYRENPVERRAGERIAGD